MTRRILFPLLVISIVGILGAVTITYLVEDLRWRAQVLGKKAAGDLEGISWPDLLTMLSPGSPIWLQPISEGHSLYGTIRNPHTTEADVVSGGEVFRSKCSNCHEGHGAGGAPDLSLNAFKYGASDWAIFNVIRHGVAGSAMQPMSLEDETIWQTIAYIRTLAARQIESQTAAVNDVHLVEVTADQLRNTHDDPGNWLTYSGNYDGSRFSKLDQINTTNVERMHVDWVLQLQTTEAHSESTPLVAGDLMFFTESPNRDLAVNKTTGHLVWAKQRPLSAKLTNCCGPHNRGVAILGDKIYRGTLDGFLIARNALTGDLVWEVEVGAAASGHSITAAPLAIDDMIITGIAGGEYGIRGYLDAYDAATGERRWRLYTIPAVGEPGNETWAGDSWKNGGGPTWMTGSYDPVARLLYWGVGNPAPDFNGDDREGDNLYTNSVLAVDVDTGKMRWHFQFTPHDLHDWDSNQVPVLVNTDINGQARQLLLTANKNGFGYVLDRITGEFITAHEVVGQTWAASIDANGRPVKNPGIAPTTRGTVIRPATTGGANWWPPSYNPLTNLVHYSVLESENIYFKSEVPYEEGSSFVGSAGQRSSGERHGPAVKAFHAGSGELAWEYRLPPRSNWPQVGGSLTTAGKLVIFGDRDNFYVLDAATGKELWRKNLGASIHAAPITYMSEGRQRIAIIAGRSVYTLSVE